MGLRSVLAVPVVYRLFRHAIAKSTYVKSCVRPRPGERVLDIGCGPGDILSELGEVDYVGVDVSEEYMEAARARYGTRGTFVCKSVKDLVMDEPGQFDLVLATGVVHHLGDAEARDLFRVGAAALRPGGRLVTLDGCFVPGQSRIARYLLGKDRGEFVRDEAAYLALAREAFSDVKASIRSNLLRIPYTHLVLECTA